MIQPMVIAPAVPPIWNIGVIKRARSAMPERWINVGIQFDRR